MTKVIIKNNLSFSELTYKIEDKMGAEAVTGSERKFWGGKRRLRFWCPPLVECCLKIKKIYSCQGAKKGKKKDVKYARIVRESWNEDCLFQKSKGRIIYIKVLIVCFCRVFLLKNGMPHKWLLIYISNFDSSQIPNFKHWKVGIVQIICYFTRQLLNHGYLSQSYCMRGASLVAKC